MSFVGHSSMMTQPDSQVGSIEKKDLKSCSVREEDMKAVRDSYTTSDLLTVKTTTSSEHDFIS